MIDHITLPVSNYEESKAFYKKALKPLGYALQQDAVEEKWAGFGTGSNVGMRNFWIKESTKEVNATKYCIAFRASGKEMVNEFYKAAIAAGGQDNGAPDYREEYSSEETHYYAAFVLDPDGWNIEAVFDETV